MLVAVGKTGGAREVGMRARLLSKPWLLDETLVYQMDNINEVYKKGQNKLHLLKTLRSFGVQRVIIKAFYDSVLAWAICYGVIVGAAVSQQQTGRD